MEIEVLKSELHEKIEKSNQRQLEQLYGLMLDYFGSQIEIGGEEDELSDIQMQMINKGLAQADEGLGSPFEDVFKRVSAKHGLNG